MTGPHAFPQAPPKGIALFDLDGTLIPWDCQLLFRHFVVRREPWRIVFLPLFLLFLPVAGLLGSEGMKRVFLSFLWGMDRETLEGHARDFAQALMPAIYPELRGRLEEHRRRGDFLILASASPEWYVVEIGRMLGFDLSLGTPVEQGGIFPELSNHKGEAKVERLRHVLPASWFDGGVLRECHGYTDSVADLPMLRLCVRATVVNPSSTLRAIAVEKPWEVVTPSRPWSGRLGFAWRALAMLLGLGRDPGGLRWPVGVHENAER